MIDNVSLKPLLNWKKYGKLGYCVGADIGASGIRIRLSNPNKITDFIDLPHSKANCAKNIYDRLDDVDKKLKKYVPGATCFGSAFAIPGIRTGTDVVPNNWPLPDSARTIRTTLFPEGLYPKEHHRLLNDMEAGAYGLVQSQKEGSIGQYFRKLWGGDGPIISEKRTAVMALGSGLGAAIIVHDSFNKTPFVISSELGYLQAPRVAANHENFKEDNKLTQILSEHYYKDGQMPCYEDFASARGIIALYKALTNKENLNAGEIAELAKKGDACAYKAIKLHYLYFTRFAKNIGATLRCETVVMALSNQVSNDWLIKEIVDDMKKEFNDSTRPQWIKDIRVYSQTKDMNFNLNGVTFMAHNCMK